MPDTDVERFCRLCLADRALWERLGALTDRRAFVGLAVTLAAEHGLALTVAELEAALDARARAWVERWVPA